MAFRKSFYPEWVKFPGVTMPGVRRRPPRFWHTNPKAFTGNTGQTYIGAVETPPVEYMKQGSIMKTPSAFNLGAHSPASAKTRMMYASPRPLLQTRGFAVRSKLRRSAQLQLLPSAELPFYAKTNVPRYISEVQTIGAIQPVRLTKIWRGRARSGMMKARLRAQGLGVPLGRFRKTRPASPEVMLRMAQRRAMLDAARKSPRKLLLRHPGGVSADWVKGPNRMIWGMRPQPPGV